MKRVAAFSLCVITLACFIAGFTVDNAWKNSSASKPSSIDTENVECATEYTTHKGFQGTGDKLFCLPTGRCPDNPPHWPNRSDVGYGWRPEGGILDGQACVVSLHFDHLPASLHASQEP